MKKRTTTKCIVWSCLINGIAWVWCSYILAFLGKTDIAEGLSKVAVTEIIGVVLVYCAKSLFEKREGFGSVGKENVGTGVPDYPSAGKGEADNSSDAGDKYTRDL